MSAADFSICQGWFKVYHTPYGRYREKIEIGGPRKDVLVDLTSEKEPRTIEDTSQ